MEHIDNKTLVDIMKEYVDLTSQIRVLSAVQIEEGATARDYSDHLRKDYSCIGKIGLRTRQILQGFIYPLIRQEEPLEIEVLYHLQEFCNMLLEPASGEELDLLLLFDISRRLVDEFERASDVNAPYITELLDQEEVIEDIRYLLSFGRDDNYRKAFFLLNNLRMWETDY